MANTFRGGIIFHETENYTFTGEQHERDENYHLIDRDGNDHLISIEDFWSWYDTVTVPSTLIRQMDLTTDKKIEQLLDLVWRTKEIF